MELNIAITSQNKKTVFEHAGRCTRFLVYHIKDNELVNKSLIEITKEESLHNFFHSNSTDTIVLNPLQGINMLLTGGIGDGAIRKLANVGIATHLIEEKDPDVAIEKLLNGTLAAKKSGNCGCSGNHDDHNHDHKHEHKHGEHGHGNGNCGHHNH
ncbi:NifB/NifX family molybdenum-iron cluster-binding protein [Lutibacter sp. TH_r2]|uniref:NifB/NifX family molybdenum-iron cluster-binding protein n=1 Tax=Lutibacter sp. TH_r2 TaxID=3082083 RepID=UPI002954BF0A|nr:NifB/NifX family molybdenum-iron cluster-binding protein [Lutibacter sp. TH_r2]MDV7187581.1 NifB/NifX family molybdenum-iron cluster-binding protein [Lutibacter sp. TH_r2]